MKALNGSCSFPAMFVKQLIGMQFMPLLCDRLFVMRAGNPESLNGQSIFKLQSKTELNEFIFYSLPGAPIASSTTTETVNLICLPSMNLST